MKLIACTVHRAYVLSAYSRRCHGDWPEHIHIERKQMLRKDPNLGARLKTLEQGAATIVWAAVSKDLEKIGGKYLENCQIAKNGVPIMETGQRDTRRMLTVPRKGESFGHYP